MNPNTSIRIPAHLWEYRMAPSETVFLAYLYELKLAHLRGENNFKVESYSANEIVDSTPIKMSMAMFYRFRKTLIRKRLLLPTIFAGVQHYELNPSEFKRWHDAIHKISFELLENSM